MKKMLTFKEKHM